MLKENVNLYLYKCPLHRYTFEIKDMREWAENQSFGLVLNLFCGKTKLNVDEIRNDLDEEMKADYHLDAYECIQLWKEPIFDSIVLDPPYAYRKSMEMYGGRKASSFLMVKEHIPKVLKQGGKVITFGYHSFSMGIKRGFETESVAIFSHGGAIHDTISTVEVFNNLT